MVVNSATFFPKCSIATKTPSTISTKDGGNGLSLPRKHVGTRMLVVTMAGANRSLPLHGSVNDCLNATGLFPPLGHQSGSTERQVFMRSPQISRSDQQMNHYFEWKPLCSALSFPFCLGCKSPHGDSSEISILPFRRLGDQSCP